MYVGVTNDIKRRTYEHKTGLCEGFTKKYKVQKLVYYEEYHDVIKAIEREKQLKHWTREKKNQLVEKQNPELKDLFEKFFD